MLSFATFLFMLYNRNASKYSLVSLFPKTQFQEDDDDDDFSGPALGGHISMRSDSDTEDDGPPMMGNLHSVHKHLTVPSKKPFSI